MELTLEEELAQVRARARKRAAEAQAGGLKPWELAARIKDAELARVLKAKMAEMKAIDPHAIAAFNDALREEAMSIQPLRAIPERV